MPPAKFKSSRTPSYTVENAIEEAYALLEGRFGKVEQEATVQLASFLYTVKAREDFQLRKDEEEPPYGGGLTS